MYKRTKRFHLYVFMLNVVLILLSATAATAQRSLDAARARERELNRAAQQVDPDSRDADRIYRDAANATRERERLEQQERQRSENTRSSLDNARAREQALNAAAQSVDPNSRDADRIYRDAASATRERERLERQERPQGVRRNNPQPYSSLERTPYYYGARDIDFYARNPGGRDPYYKYGEKYYNRYTNEVSQTLSSKGQEFIGTVGPAIQHLIEERLGADPVAFARMERNPIAFSRFVTEIHVRAYTDSGWAELSSSDQWRIVRAIDGRDLMGRAAINAAIQLSPGLFGIRSR